MERWYSTDPEETRRVFSANIRKAIPSLITLSGPVFSVPLSKVKCESLEIRVNKKYYKWPRDNSTHQIYINLDADPQILRNLNLLCLVLVTPSPRQLTGQSKTSLPHTRSLLRAAVLK